MRGEFINQKVKRKLRQEQLLCTLDKTAELTKQLKHQQHRNDTTVDQMKTLVTPFQETQSPSPSFKSGNSSAKGKGDLEK